MQIGKWQINDEIIARLLSAQTTGYVYAITDGTAVKLGKSADHPTLRLATLQTGNPRRLRLVAYTIGLKEQVVHKLFRRDRLLGEWFRITARLLDFIATWGWVEETEFDQLSTSLGVPNLQDRLARRKVAVSLWG